MTVDRLKNLLYNYPYIPREQQSIRQEIRNIIRDKDSTEYSISAMVLNDMPKGNNTSDPTYQLYATIQRMYDRYAQQVERLQQKYDDLEHYREFVERLLDLLGINEVKVIRATYFKGVRRWETICRETHYCDSQVRHIHNSAIKKMVNAA